MESHRPYSESSSTQCTSAPDRTSSVSLSTSSDTTVVPKATLINRTIHPTHQPHSTPTQNTPLTLDDLRTFVSAYLTTQYSLRQHLANALPLSTTPPPPGGRLSPPHWQRWHAVAALGHGRRPTARACADARALRLLCGAAGLDTALLEPPLSSLRRGGGAFARAESGAAVLRRGGAAELALLLRAERALVRGLWPAGGLRGGGCWGGVVEGGREWTWVEAEIARWFDGLEGPVEFRLSSRARRILRDVDGNGNEDGTLEKSVTMPRMEALREALIRMAERSKDIEDRSARQIQHDDDVHPVYRASLPPPTESFTPQDTNTGSQTQTAHHSISIRVPAPVTNVRLGTLPIETAKILRCLCGCLHEINITLNIQPSAEMEERCKRAADGMTLMQRTSSGSNALDKLSRPPDLYSKMGSLRRMSRRQRFSMIEDDEIQEIRFHSTH